MSSIIVLEVNNKNYTGWNKVRVRRSMDEFLGSFTLQLVDGGDDSPFGQVYPGDQSRIYARTGEGSQVQEVEILNGYIDSRERFRSGSDTGMSVGGSDLAQDLVDCSASVTSNQWTKATLAKITSDLITPYGLTLVDNAGDTTIFKNFRLQNGESNFAAIERAARQVGVLPLTNAAGGVVLTHAKSSETTPVANLIDGQNIKTLRESLTRRARFSEYIFRGQNTGGGSAWTPTTTQIEARATDSAIDRYRPLIILADGSTSKATLQKRVNWEAQVRAGRALTHSVEVVDWFIPATAGSDPQPWEINTIINLVSTKMGLETRRLITAVEFILDSAGGKVTNLELRDPLTYASNPSDKVGF